ncbi:MAG: glutamate racemase [Spirochaetales bacterium]
MDRRPVAVIDSGIGGLPYLDWLQEHLPLERFVYVADRRNFPYGEKTPQRVREAVAQLSRDLLEHYQPKLMVVACNTASVLALDHLRSVFPGPVVGVVPAVKTAAGRTRNGRIGVLATQRTIEGGYLERLVAEFCPGRQVSCWAAGDIVTLVEDDPLKPDPEARERILSHWASVVREFGADTLVLGCTHFLHVTRELQVHLGPEVVLLDSREGVGRRVETLLDQGGLQSVARSARSVLHFTADPAWPEAELAAHEGKYRHFAAQFGLEYGGPWSRA